MALTPVEVRHIQLKRGMFGYRKPAVHRMMDDIADSFETVWRERSQLVERVEELEAEVARHVELEGLLRSTLVSAEKASRDLKDIAQKEADLIVTEANAEARKVLRHAITEKETLLSDVRRVQAVLRSALSVVDEAPTGSAERIPVPEPVPAPVEARPAPAARPPERVAAERDGFGATMAEWPTGGRTPEPESESDSESEREPVPAFELPSSLEPAGGIRKLAG
jgi:cell division initiation protein